MTCNICKRDWLFLLLIASAAGCIFVGVGFNFGIEGDDIFYISPIFRENYTNAHQTLSSMKQGRLLLQSTYNNLYLLLGESQIEMHFVFAVLLAATAILFYLFMRRHFSPVQSLVSALFFLAYSGKYEIIGWASAGLYLLVICLMFLMAMIATRARGSLLSRMTLVSIIYWISLHIYEILVPVAPLPAIWLAFEIWNRRRQAAWTDAVAVSLPLCVTGIHVAILGSSAHPIWERSGGSGFWDFFFAVPSTIAKTVDSFLGLRHIDLVMANFASARYVTFAAHDLWFSAGMALLVAIVLIALKAAWDSREFGQAGTGKSLYWILFGGWLLLVSPAINTPEVMGMAFTPSRLTYLPSLGASILLAAALERFGSRILATAALVLVCIEFLVLHTILFQYASTAQYDGDLRERLRALHLTFVPGDSLAIRLAPNDFMFKVWTTIPSKFVNGSAQSIILLDNPNLQFHDDSFPDHLRLIYYGDRSDAPQHRATHVIQQAPDGSLCVLQSGSCSQ